MVTSYTPDPEILEPLPLLHPFILALRIKPSSNLGTKLYFNSLESASILSFPQSRYFHHYYSEYANICSRMDIDLVQQSTELITNTRVSYKFIFTFLFCKTQLTALVHRIIRNMNKIFLKKY